MDDGMMLNIVTDSADASAAKNKKNIPKLSEIAARLKRGGWHARRLHARRIVQRMSKAAKAPTESQDAFKDNSVKNVSDSKQEISVQNRKRPMPQNSVNEHEKGASGGQAHSNKRQRPDDARQKTGAVVSSLFSSNPELPQPENESDEDELLPLEPAPVFAADATFAGIGVDPLLSSHLESRLGFSKPTPIQNGAVPLLLAAANRDAIVQAQTGSGKTLAFLLPILHKLVRSSAEAAPETSESFQNKKESFASADFYSRTAGTLAIILAPTRELARQITDVLDSLLRYSTHGNDSAGAETSSDTNMAADARRIYRHWIVSGIVVGGEKKKSEKARLRKGVNILVCTPGRLLDHLKTTGSFEVGNLRWLVLDEADNLLHLGFEETLKEILQLLDAKRDAAIAQGRRVHVAGWPRMRQTVLCSATIEAGVRRLAETALVSPVFVGARGDKISVLRAPPEAASAIDSSSDKPQETKKESEISETDDSKIVIPKQLRQAYVVAPSKLRLVNLVALIRKIANPPKPIKMIVFMATGDSVDWHFDAFSHALDFDGKSNRNDSDDEDDMLDAVKNSKAASDSDKNVSANASSAALTVARLKSGAECASLFPNARLFKLHGSMSPEQRLAAYAGFCAASNDNSASILLCTDVAARGLDLPDVAHIIQYDPPAEMRDYVHRIGRTARLGRQGEATIFLMPNEMGYIDVLKPLGCDLRETKGLIESLAKIPFGGVLSERPNAASAKKKARKTFEVVATDLHMAFERYVLASASNLDLAQRAYTSQIRSYATHVAGERHVFHVKNLHLGHVAKSFALREAPTGVAGRLSHTIAKERKAAAAANRKHDGPVSAAAMRRKAAAMASAAMTSEFADGLAVSSSRNRSKNSKE